MLPIYPRKVDDLKTLEIVFVKYVSQLSYPLSLASSSSRKNKVNKITPWMAEKNARTNSRYDDVV